MTDAATTRPRPHHAGHRERLRERARSAGLPALPDYELLELFLFRSQPQGDVKPIAKALLARFGSLAAVLAASVEDLMTVRAEDIRGRSKGVGAETALDLAALHEVARRVLKEEAAARPVITSWNALLAYVRVALQHEPREQFRVENHSLLARAQPLAAQPIERRPGSGLSECPLWVVSGHCKSPFRT